MIILHAAIQPPAEDEPDIIEGHNVALLVSSYASDEERRIVADLIKRIEEVRDGS